MKTYEYLLFDLDGTLTYSHPGIFACIRYALEKFGREEPTEETLRKCVGPTLMYSFSHYFNMTDEDAAKATAVYRERYAKVGWQENEPIEGAKETLEKLKVAGYKLAMATSKPKIFADRIADKFSFTSLFDVIVGCGLDGSLPTKASVIEEAVRRLNAAKENCLMIGDRKHDIEGARIAGVDVAGLDVGYAESGELLFEKPDYYFKGFEELTGFLLKEKKEKA